MKDEITQLREENERLTLLVSLLIEKNKQLQEQLSSFAKTGEKQNNLSYPATGTGIKQMQPLSSTPQKESEQMQPLSSTPQKESEQMQPLSSTPQKESEQMQPLSSTPQKESEQMQPLSSTPQKESEQMQPLSSTPQKESEQMQPLSSTSQKESEQMQPLSSTPQKESETNKANERIFANILRKNVFAGRRQTAANAAKILIQLQTIPNNTHKQLCDLTGLSAAGLAKHIMMLKRKGLIVRTAFQHYNLTEKALMLLREAAQ